MRNKSSHSKPVTANESALRNRLLAALLLTSAGLSMIPNGWDAINTTLRCWRYRQEWNENGLPYNYGDPWMMDLHRLLEKHVGQKDGILMCPNRLQYPDQVCDIRSTDWLYYPYDEDSTIENLLNVLNLTNLFQKTGIYRHHTLYGHMLY